MTGEVGELVAQLMGDATLYTDGGGRVASAGLPIAGADRISRFFVGIRRRSAVTPTFEFVSVNGRPGALVRVGGRLDRAISFELDGELVRAIYIVRNPEKLRHLGSGAASGSVLSGSRSAAKNSN